MPKLKPCKGLVKRVRVTKNGKVLARGCGSVHRRVRKSSKQKRRLYKSHVLSADGVKGIKKLLGY